MIETVKNDFSETENNKLRKKKFLKSFKVKTNNFIVPQVSYSNLFYILLRNCFKDQYLILKNQIWRRIN